MRVIFPNKTSPSSSRFTKVLGFIPTAIFVSSVFFPVLNFILPKFGLQAPHEYLGLSVNGIGKGYYWQLISFSFLFSADLTITQQFLIKITLVYIVLNSMVRLFIQKLGNIRFVLFWLGQSLIIGVLSLILMRYQQNDTIIYGCIPILAGFTTVGIFLDPDKKVGLPIFPIYFSVKWVALLVLGFVFVVFISQNQWITILNSFLSIILAVLYCKYERLRNPFSSDLSL